MRKPISKSLRFSVLRRDDFTCRYCGAKPPDVVLHLDHVLAVANGGENVFDNLVTACLPCNLGKGVGDASSPAATKRSGAKPQRPPVEFFWATDYTVPKSPVIADARCVLRPTHPESTHPWEWEEFNRYWGNKTPVGQRHFYSTHGASTAGFSPYEAAMYAIEILHNNWASFQSYVNFIDDLVILASLGHIPQYVAPSVLRAVHYENCHSRCGNKPRDYEDIADSVADQAIAAFKPFIDREHVPWQS